MKIIEILKKIANGEIEKGTKLWLEECSFNFDGDRFTNEQHPFGNSIFLSTRFLNKEVELIPPKEKKYRVRFKLLGSSKEGSFLSWEKCPYGVFLSIQEGTGDIKTQFTKSELQSIEPVRKFLADAEGGYELIEVIEVPEDETY